MTKIRYIIQLRNRFDNTTARRFVFNLLTHIYLSRSFIKGNLYPICCVIKIVLSRVHLVDLKIFISIIINLIKKVKEIMKVDPVVCTLWTIWDRSEQWRQTLGGGSCSTLRPFPPSHSSICCCRRRLSTGGEYSSL